MQVEMDYGRNGLIIDVPNNTDVFLVQEMPPVPKERTAIQYALNHPIDSPPLRTRVEKGMKVTIVHTNITRATPNNILIPPILQELEANGVESEDITLLNAVGTHRAQTQPELRQMLGKDIVNKYRCIQELLIL